MGLEQGLEIKIVMEREGAVLGNGPKKKWNNFFWLRIRAVLVTPKNSLGS